MTARQFGFVSAIAAFVILGWHSPAHAYLDPGTGSMILQGLIGAVVGGLIAVKLYWARLKNFFSNNRARPPEEDHDRRSGPN